MPNKVNFLRGQPAGVYLMFSTEFWERFSYYGFLGILVLFLVDSPASGGLGWRRTDALVLLGYILGMIWFAPIIGGWIADRFIGARAAVIVGCVGLMASNFLLAAAAFLPHVLYTPHELHGLEESAVALGTSLQGSDGLVSACLYGGLAVMVLSAGLFKSNASALVSQLYAPGDLRRNAGFTLFYMGVNLGALLAPLGAGTLGERAGWYLGFLLAGVGMLAGLTIFLSFVRRHFPARARPSIERSRAAPHMLADPGVRLVLFLAVFAVIFTVGLMMYGGLLNLYAADKVDRRIGGLEIPATWFLALNPLCIILFGPAVSQIWTAVAQRTSRSLFALKIACGLALEAIAFVLIALVDIARGEAPAPLWILPAFYVLLTFGELCVIPVGLAEISRLAPANAVGLLMGIWFFTMGVGSIIAGTLGAAAQAGQMALTFGGVAAVAAAGSTVLFALWWIILSRKTSDLLERELP